MDALSAAFQERIPLAEMILLRMMVSRGHARNLPEMITSYRELEREIAEEDRLKNSRGRANTMDRVREQLRKKKEVKKPKLPEEDLLKDPVLNGNGIRRPKI